MIRERVLVFRLGFETVFVKTIQFLKPRRFRVGRENSPNFLVQIPTGKGELGTDFQSKLHCMDSLSAENFQILEQGILLLESIANETYERKHERIDASIGEHFRHILEHYELFWEGLKTGHIDYDNRKRNPKLESDRLFAIKTLMELTAKFQNESFSLESVTISQNNNPMEEVPFVPSTTNRELKFLVSHTVHHYAIISILVKLDGGSLPEGFGFSPSTLFAKVTEKTR